MAGYPGYEFVGGADPYAYAAPAPFAGAPYTAPPPMGMAPHAYPGPGGGSEELRTVFITGFPTDVKERELNNMLRFIPGYEASQMNWKNGQAQGFALFVSGGTARSACEQIGGLCFDDGVHLRAEMARKNMYIKDDMGGPAKRSRVTGGYVTPSSGGGAPPPYAAGPRTISQNKDNPPCNTLFVGNLSDAVQEGDLQALFAAQPGFQQLKLLRTGRAVNCFVEFDTIETATACHQTQQGVVVPSSDRGPLRIQFSKNPFGRKRDSSAMLDSRGSGLLPGADGSQQLAPAFSGPPSTGGYGGGGGASTGGGPASGGGGGGAPGL